MIPASLLTATYLAAGILVSALVLWQAQRYWRKRPSARRAQQPQQVRARSTAATLPLRAAAADNAAVASAVAAVGTSWIDRPLFAGLDEASMRRDRNDLPRVDYDDLPTVDNSDYLFGTITPALAALLPESGARRKELKKELRAAGFFQPHAWHNLAAVRYVAVMAAIILFGTLLVLAPPQAELPLAVLLVVASALGWAVPRLYVKNRAHERTGQIERGMPDLLDMLNMCVSQGLNVQDSLNRVSAELRPVYPALSRELSIVSEQAEVGTLEQALVNFSERVDVPEVRSFTSLLIQTERMGTNISDALIEYSDNMRESLRQRADEKANRATFKLLFPTVLCLMPAVYMFLLGPAVIELSHFFGDGGQNLLDSGQQAIQELNEQQFTQQP